MKQQILSAALAFCLGGSSPPAAYVWQEAPLLQEDSFTEESADELDASDNTATASQNLPLLQESVIVLAETSISRSVTIDDLTPAKVYGAMIALKDQDKFREGADWTNYYPYSDSLGYYEWKGGALGGSNIVAAGCVAFAFELSDTAFGSMKARMYSKGGFSFDDIKVGDILRINNDSHTIIVLEVSDTGVIVAEGNLNGKVHWGWALSKDEVMRITTHYITRYPEGYVSPDDSTANNEVGSGTLATGLNWKLTKAGTLAISGNGAMPTDFSGPSDQPWSAHSSQIRKIVIADGVTNIGPSAFYGNAALSVEIPNSVASIGNNAFYNCSLIYASIPSGVKTIGNDAFRQCPNLTSVTVSEGVETIGERAFQGCTQLASVDLPASIKEMGAGAFFDCTELSSVTFAQGSNQVKMGADLFARCWKLSAITLPQSINCISKGMFQVCRTLDNVIIPQGVESIGDSAFASCSSLAIAIIPDSVTTIETAAFSACNSLKDIYFTGTEAQWRGISKIGDTASALSNVTIHYNFTPAAPPAPDEGDDNNTGDDTGDNTGDNNGDNTGSNNGDNTGSNNGDNTGSNNGDNTGDNNGDNTGDSNGDNAGNNTDNNTGDNNSDNTGNSTGNNTGNNTDDDNGDNTGNSTGDNTGSSTGDNTGGNAGNNTGNNTGGSTGDNTGNSAGDNTGNNAGGDNAGNDTGDNTSSTNSSTDNSSGSSTGSNAIAANEIINMISAAGENTAARGNSAAGQNAMGRENAAAREIVTVTITRDKNINTLSNAVMKSLLAHSNVELVLECTYEGVDYTIVIPAGAALDNDIPWYGPLYLLSVYGNRTSPYSAPNATEGSGYTVQANDTMSKIAQKNGMTLAELAAMNPEIKNIDSIRIGQIIKVK